MTSRICWRLVDVVSRLHDASEREDDRGDLAACGSRPGHAFREVFAELSRKFVGFSDVLADISERTTLSSNNDLLRIYEKWLRTGSARDGQRLIELGIVPNNSVGKRFLQ